MRHLFSELFRGTAQLLPQSLVNSSNSHNNILMATARITSGDCHWFRCHIFNQEGEKIKTDK